MSQPQTEADLVGGVAEEEEDAGVEDVGAGAEEDVVQLRALILQKQLMLLDLERTRMQPQTQMPLHPLQIHPVHVGVEDPVVDAEGVVGEEGVVAEEVGVEVEAQEEVQLHLDFVQLGLHHLLFLQIRIRQRPEEKAPVKSEDIGQRLYVNALFVVLFILLEVEAKC